MSYPGKIFQLLALLIFVTPGVFATTIEGTALLSDSSSYEDITVKLFLVEAPYWLPTISLGGCLILLLALSIFLRRKKRSIKITYCLLILVLAVAAHALVTTVFVTSEDGRYYFTDYYGDARYLLTFSKDNYHPAYYGPFLAEDGLDYTVSDTTLYPTNIPLTTPTPVHTATPLPTIEATATPFPTTGAGTPTNTPSPYSTCTPSPVPTGWPTWPECPGHPDHCDFPECVCNAYEPYDSEYAMIGEMLSAGWKTTHDWNCAFPCWYGPFPQQDGGLVTMSIDSTCYPTPNPNYQHAYLYLDPNLNCSDVEINYTAQLHLMIDVPACSGDIEHLYCNHSGTIPIVTPAIVSADDPTGPPLDFLTFDPDGMAWIRLRLSPDPHADRLRPLNLVIHTNGQDIEKDVPLLYSQGDMVFSDAICIYRSLSTIVPDLPCDCLVVPGDTQYAAIMVSGYECSIVPVVALDFLVEMTPTPGLQPSDKLKVSKWENAFGLPTGLPTPVVTPDFIDSDRYRFQIRVRDYAASQSGTPGTLTVSSIIWNNQTPMPVDDETEMILSPQGTPGVWITDPMILVSDDVDDDYMFFGVADDMPNDRTHKVTIDSEVVAKYYPFGMATQTPAPRVIEQIATMEYETFRFNTVIYEVNIGGTPIPVINPIWVSENIEDVKNVYASVGVKIESNPIQIITPDPTFSIDVEEVTIGSPEFEAILDSIGPENDPNDFYLIFINNLYIPITPTNTPTPPPGSTSSPTPTITATPPPGSTATLTPTPFRREVGGVASYSGECFSGVDGRSNNCLINSYAVNSIPLYLVTSHEIGHCLTRYGHFDRFESLMKATTNEWHFPYNLSVFSPKRFFDTPLPTPTCPNNVTPTPKNQEDRVHEHSQVN